MMLLLGETCQTLWSVSPTWVTEQAQLGGVKGQEEAKTVEVVPTPRDTTPAAWGGNHWNFLCVIVTFIVTDVPEFFLAPHGKLLMGRGSASSALWRTWKWTDTGMK
ncbi:hypothetical protein WISP_52851 [Willisornis vidua]|uniref:Uncharacterized protein n=1 Tax=Willisornis vidua TaxID=1566151 RepID=A0ABQ9DI83_9PASS|nr:hypothetical protein WISP_52851 [Willisornis vidua]